MKSIQIDIARATIKGVKTGKISLSGDLTLVNATTIKSKVQQAINDFQELHIETKNITNIDLSAVQIFLSLKKQLLAMKGKSVKLDLQLPQDLKTLMSQSGFSTLFNTQTN